MIVNWPVLIGALLLAQGLLLLFAGYRFLRFFLAVLGFVGGASLVFFALSQTGYSSQVVALGAALGGALIGTLLAYPLYLVGMFLQGASVFVLLAYAFGLQEPPLIPVLAFLVGGTLCVVFRKPIIILSTAIEGAASLLAGISILLGKNQALDALDSYTNFQPPPQIPAPVYAALIVALILFGAWTQHKGLRRREYVPRKRPKEPEN